MGQIHLYMDGAAVIGDIYGTDEELLSALKRLSFELGFRDISSTAILAYVIDGLNQNEFLSQGEEEK